ncbi:MAG: SagB family peptide dehydrogenase [Anaerolineales bacterium]|nr:SagB family peptide dehydrogenase [Anaerolineales bacterium]
MNSFDLLTQDFVLSFKEGISLVEQADGSAVLESPGANLPLGQASKGMRAALRLLSTQGAIEKELVDLAGQHDGSAGLPKMLYYLQRFTQSGLICHTVTSNGSKLATIVPTSPIYQFRLVEPALHEPYSLSRFAYLHQNGGQFVLESPLAQAKIVLHCWQATAMLHGLATSRTLTELGKDFQDITDASISLFVSLLLGCDMVQRAGKEEPEALAQWDFHDLLFHSRSRLGRYTGPYGATYRFRDKTQPLPVVKPLMSEETISLYKPDLDTLKKDDPSFTCVLEERQSMRKQDGERPITLEQLGEFLYRTARIRALHQAEQGLYEYSSRPYPNGGACYELELYVAARACTGLSQGLYHYDPREHQLCKLAGRADAVNILLQEASYATAEQSRPQVLIILTARFHRVTWKYEAMAYALILKNVGVLYQTMYLVATAMGLAACALGGGNSDLFAAAAGTDYFAETSVGEFILGTKAGR